MLESEVKSSAQLKYINAQSVGSKQEELEAIVPQKNYGIATITETGGVTSMTGVLSGWLLALQKGQEKERWWGFHILGRLLTV